MCLEHAKESDYIANKAESLISLDSNGTTSHRTVRIYCGAHGHFKDVTLKCSDRTCSTCRKKIYFKLFKSWHSLVDTMKSPKLLTLTTINVQDLTKKHLTFIRSSFIKLMRRKYYKDRIKGGLYVIELKNIGNGWNVHLHALIETLPGMDGFLIQKRISEDWQSITEHSKIVDIRQAKNPQKSLRYILKYLTKTPEINDQHDLYNAVLKGSRLIQTFGELYSTKPEKKKLLCPECGCDWWMSEFELLEIILRANGRILRKKRKYLNSGNDP